MPQNLQQVSYLTVAPDDDGQRLDNWLLARLKGVPRSHIYRIIRSGEVRVDRGRAKPRQKLTAGQQVRVPPVRKSPPKNAHLDPERAAELDSCVLLRLDDILVLNKPAGLAVHAGSGQSIGLIDLARARWGDDWQLGHRLDRATSGCLLLVRKRALLNAFQQALADGQVLKEYLALAHGRWPAELRRIDSVLARSGEVAGERRMQSDAQGKQARSLFLCQASSAQASRLLVRIETGRTHQIRVQAAEAGHPIIGDDKYGRRQLDRALPLERPPGLCLHARRLQLELAGVTIDQTAAEPAAMTEIQQALDLAE